MPSAGKHPRSIYHPWPPRRAGSRWGLSAALWEDSMKASARKIVTPLRRLAPRSNERRLVTQHPRRRILSLAAGAVALPAVSRVAWAQAHPTLPITMIVPLAAGGGL